MEPGVYLRKRREAAGLTAAETARQLALMHFGMMESPRTAILAELERAEASIVPLSLAQAEVLRNVFPLDASVYEALALCHFAEPAAAAELPTPRVCAHCACSWNDPCRIHARRGTSVIDWPCSWSVDRPEICTACQLAQVTAEVIEAGRTASRAPLALTDTETLLTLVPVAPIGADRHQHRSAH